MFEIISRLNFHISFISVSNIIFVYPLYKYTFFFNMNEHLYIHIQIFCIYKTFRWALS